ncbi:putative transposable element [Trichonephila clavipes]|nr:putative transposable element [Trichonephila clavipes]
MNSGAKKSWSRPYSPRFLLTGSEPGVTEEYRIKGLMHIKYIESQCSPVLCPNDHVSGDPQGSLRIQLSLLTTTQTLNQELWPGVSFLLTTEPLWSSLAAILQRSGQGIDWLAYSNYLNLPDYFLWGCLKDNVYKNRPQSLDGLRQTLSAKILVITLPIIRSVLDSFDLRLRRIAAKKLTVWCALWAGGIIGPYFFKNDEGHNVTVNGDRYRAMINNFFIPELNNHDVQKLWLQQDGATCHTARATIDLLKDTFGDRLISSFGPVNWPPRSCDLTPLDYFL